MDEKKRIENEMSEWTEVLNSQDGVGMHGALVDDEGTFSFITYGGHGI